MDVFLNPLERRKLIMEAEVQNIMLSCFRALRESKRSKTIVETDEENRGALSICWSDDGRLGLSRLTLVIPFMTSSVPL